MASAGSVITTLAGILIFAGALGFALYLTVRSARSAGLLAPVVVGGLLRLGVMLVTLVVSVHLGESGVMFLDDKGYVEEGRRIADAWRAGQVIDPAGVGFAGSYQFGYPVLVALDLFLTNNSLVAVNLVNVVLGTATVLVTGLLARRILGSDAGRRAAWLTAVFPGAVWWSAVMMKEAFISFLVGSTLLAVTRMPRTSAVGGFCLLLATLVVSRSAAALAIALGMIVAFTMAARQSGRQVGWRSVLSLFAGLLGVTMLIALVVSKGDLQGFFVQYQRSIEAMFRLYQGSNAALIPIDSLKALIAPFPWVFDNATRNWDRGLYPGMWALYMLYPLALLGVWRLRRRPEIALIGVVIVLTVLFNAVTLGFGFRQRSSIEPLILIAAVGGMVSWRQATRFGALGLLAIAVAAGAQSQSLAVGLAIAAAGGLLLWVSTVLPAERFPMALPASSIRVAVTRLKLGPLARDLLGRATSSLGELRGTAPASSSLGGSTFARARAALGSLRGVAPPPAEPPPGRAGRRSRKALDSLRNVAPPPPERPQRRPGRRSRKALDRLRSFAPPPAEPPQRRPGRRVRLDPESRLDRAPRRLRKLISRLLRRRG